MIERMTVATRDYFNNYYRLPDARKGKIQSKATGFFEFDWYLPRDPRLGYEDTGLNMQVLVTNNRGDVAWHGRIEAIEQDFERGKRGGLQCMALGYWSSTYDLTDTGTVSSGTDAASQVNDVLTTRGDTPQLDSSKGTRLSSGQFSTVSAYATGTSQDERSGDIIQKMLAVGTSSNQQVQASVYENRGLNTTAISPSTVRYQVSRRFTSALSARRELSSIYNRIIIYYKLSGTVTRNVDNNTASQAVLAVDYGSGSRTSLIRSFIKDVTSQGNKTGSEITAQSTTLKSFYANPIAIGSVSLGPGVTIFDVQQGQEVPHYTIRPGFVAQFTDINPRDTNLPGFSSSFLISQTSYDMETGVLELTPEDTSRLQELLA